MKVDDIVRIKSEYLAYWFPQPGVVLRIKGGMATIRKKSGATLTLRVSILEVVNENAS